MIIGTAGHIDHGKTALVRALTGVNTDRLKEEKARGISIDLGYAYLPGPAGTILGFVDVPGHEKFIHNMLAGATGIDYALIVVAADDGVMPQTREHLAILDLLGIARGAVALTKVDLVGTDRCAAVIREITGVLGATAFSNAEIIPVSILSGEGLGYLRDTFFAAAAIAKRKQATGSFRLVVDRSFILSGIGTVVTGTVLSGAVQVGDKVTVSPSGIPARVRSIHAQNRQAVWGVAGERCALNLAGEGVSKDAIARGDVVLDPALHAPTSRVDATLRLLPDGLKPVTQWMPVRLYHGAVEVGARVVPLEASPLTPGKTGRVQLVLERPIAAAVHDPFILRDTSAQHTLGGGIFLDLRAPQRRRRAPERLAQLDARAHTDHAFALTVLLESSPFFVDIAGFVRDRALTADALAAMVREAGLVVLEPDNIAFSGERWRAVASEISAVLKKFHGENPQARGMNLDQLRLALTLRLPAKLVRSVVQTLARAGNISLDGAVASLPDHAMQLGSTDALLWAKLSPLLSGEARFRPPRVAELAAKLPAPDSSVRRLLKSLAKMSAVVEVAEDHFFLRATVAEMIDIAAEIAAASVDGEFGAAQLRDRLDNGRKVAIQILEFFDRSGVTLRRGDSRRINPQRRDYFRNARAVPIASGREAPPVGRPVFKTGSGR